MSSSQKKVILRRLLGDLLHGYLPMSGFVESGSVTLLNLEGRRATVPVSEVKTICFVRDFNLADLVDPERLQRRTFLARPRGEGVWIRIVFRGEGDVLEGLAPTDITLLDALTTDAGLFLSPPDVRTNTQRIYIPRSAMESVELLSIITSPSLRRLAQAAAEAVPVADQPQQALFDGIPALAKTGKRGSHGIR